MNVTLKDFQPINCWELDLNGPLWPYTKEPEYLIDKTTDRRYWNESKNCVRLKCFLLSLGTPFVHTVMSIVYVVTRVFQLISFYYFWSNLNGEYNFKSRCEQMGKTLLKIVIAPFSIIGLELSAIYGIARPYDGRKLYASSERGMYGRDILAPCFQPNPKRHHFGGDPSLQNSF